VSCIVNTTNEQNFRSYVKPSNNLKGFIIPPFLHFLEFWLLVFEINLASYILHNTLAKDINNTSETINSKVSVCSVKKSISVKSSSVRKSRSEDVNNTKFGSFCAAILSLLFSPYFALFYSVIT